MRGPGFHSRGEDWTRDWPFGLIEAAAQAGQIVAIADPLGRLVDEEDEEGEDGEDDPRRMHGNRGRSCSSSAVAGSAA